jgi:hypothetical protein
MTHIDIILTETEQRIAKHIGSAREANNLKNNTKDGKMGKQDSLQANIEAVGAEFAVCRYLNVYPDLDMDSWAVADCVYHGYSIDVKWSPRDEADMVAKKKKASMICDIYIRVCGSMPNYKILGYNSSKELFHDSRKTDLGYGETYFIPRSEMRPIENMKKYKK